MGELVFPQLSSGAITQYSFTKTKSARTVRNVMRDGSLISYPDFGAGQLSWNLQYSGLSQIDATSIKACFDACEGPLSPFTFIDPAGNALTWTCDLTNSIWQRSSLVSITSNARDPLGGSGGFTVMNNGQSVESFTQRVSIPANYQYCFSLYASSPQSSSLTLLRAGAAMQDQQVVLVSANWNRFSSGGRLNDAGNNLTVGFSLGAGESITVYGLQLDAQLQRSSYRSTGAVGGVFTNCFWASDDFAITAEGPNSLSTQISIETTLQS